MSVVSCQLPGAGCRVVSGWLWVALWRAGVSSRGVFANSPGDFGASGSRGEPQVTFSLQVQPDLRHQTEIASEPQRGIGGDSDLPPFSLPAVTENFQPS
jgi:hypothetical protein